MTDRTEIDLPIPHAPAERERQRSRNAPETICVDGVWYDRRDTVEALTSLLAYERGKVERWRGIVIAILQADEGGQGLLFAEAMERANVELKKGN